MLPMAVTGKNVRKKLQKLKKLFDNREAIPYNTNRVIAR